MTQRLALALYRCLLAFYPKGFRLEFSAEMQVVFTQALGGRYASAGSLLWRELRDWPVALCQAHRAERKKAMVAENPSLAQPAPAHTPVPPSSWRHACLAALGHLFYLWLAAGEGLLSAFGGPLHVSSVLQSWLARLGLLVILVADLLVVLWSWRRGWPRWSLPYLGVVVTWLLLLFQSLIQNDGSLLVFIAPLVALAVLLLAALGGRWKGLQPLHERLRGDWTLSGLVYFSYVPLVFIFLLDDTPYQAIGITCSSALLALGVFLYMRGTILWWRVSVLPVAYIAASLVTIYFLRVDYFNGPRYYALDPLRLLGSWGVVGMLPLLAFGLLELTRHAYHRWLQAA